MFCFLNNILAILFILKTHVSFSNDEKADRFFSFIASNLSVRTSTMSGLTCIYKSTILAHSVIES